jgi:hypothetical protein
MSCGSLSGSDQGAISLDLLLTTLPESLVVERLGLILVLNIVGSVLLNHNTYRDVGWPTLSSYNLFGRRLS